MTELLRVRAAMGDVLAGVGLWEEAAAVHASVLKVRPPPETPAPVCR